MSIYIELPKEVEYILAQLNNWQFESYIVGGCVRDSLLNLVPKDWDITTNATPEQIKEVFHGNKTLDIGLKHGTVTVIVNNENFEITTYRKDGEYKDNRRPSSVEFISNLQEDLARRDFTINAIAYNEIEGIVDFFGGIDDLKNKLIRCVGSPYERFQEDSLRILRALRFSAIYDFNIEDNTSISIKENFHLIKNIAKERIQYELNKIILSGNYKVISRYSMCFDKYIFRHYELPLETDFTIPMFYAYIYFCLNRHTVELWLQEYKYSNKIIKQTLRLIQEVEDRKSFLEHYNENYKRVCYSKCEIKALLRKYEVSFIKDFMKLYSYIDSGYNLCIENAILEEILNNNECYSLRQLNVNGNDLKDIGIKEKHIGIIFELLLSEVINEVLLNDKKELLDKALEYKTKLKNVKGGGTL